MKAVGSIEIYKVPSGEAGGTSASIPSLAGKSFSLIRGNSPLLTSEFTIKSAGGFDLVGAPGGNLVLDERFAILIEGGKMFTARVPELASASNVSLTDDFIILYQGGVVDLTRKFLLGDLRTLILTGGPATIAPVITGGTILYIVPPADAGGPTASIPEAAGKSFLLKRTSLGLMIPQNPPGDPPNPDAEFEILSGGGFNLLKPGDILQLDERFELVLFQLAPVVGPGTQTGLEFIKGKKIINANITLADVDMNKMIQIRAGATQITLTLPDIDDVPDNSFLFIDTNINTTVEHKIATTGGQFIYMRNQSKTEVYMRPGETLQLYRDVDGWYVENDFAKIYDQVGKPDLVYKKGTNQLIADGSLVPIAQNRRLYEIAQNFGTGMVSDATWLTASGLVNGRNVPFPYRGCFSSGDGTNFRLPDLRDLALIGLKNIGGSDSERFYHNPGGFQDDQIKAPASGTLYVKQRVAAGGDIEGFRAGHNAPGSDNYDEQSFAAAYPNNNPAATLTRMQNVGLIPVINC